MVTEYNFDICAGSDSYVRVNLIDPRAGKVNLQGYTANMQLRKSYNAEPPADTLTVDNGRIVIGDTYLELHFTHEATSQIRYGKFLYDLELVTPTGLVSRILQGKINVLPEVTRIE